MTEQTTDTAPAVEPEMPATEAPDTGEPDWRTEAEKWKSLARKHEERAKANADAAAKFEEFRKSQMSEQDLAIAAARDEAANSVRREFFADRAAERFRAAAIVAGVPADEVEADLADRNLAAFYDPDTGAPNVDRIAAAVKRLAPAHRPVSPDVLGQGGRGQSSAPSAEQRLAEANAKGDWRTVLSLNSQKLADVARSQK